MVNSSGQSESVRQTLSALMDGQVEPPESDTACAAWRQDAHARECWHTYHLIGDVLRSDELAGHPARDAAFLGALRERLALEPTPLAPTPTVEPRQHRLRHRLMAPAAAAAGFVLVAGVVLVARDGTPEAARGAPAVATVAAPDHVVANGQLIRDARLDRYLSAHRQVSNGVAVQMPGAVVRSVDTIVLDAK
ncbi:MAG: sigma-E factor negative regulatory protein [Burkholderiales bacterium]|nr:sigma-E factor negative regulatory protein [Burkholderiales bacterium]